MFIFTHDDHLYFCSEKILPLSFMKPTEEFEERMKYLVSGAGLLKTQSPNTIPG